MFPGSTACPAVERYVCKLAANRPGTRSAQDGIRGMECGTNQGQTSCGNWLGRLFVCVFSVL